MEKLRITKLKALIQQQSLQKSKTTMNNTYPMTIEFQGEDEMAERNTRIKETV